MSSPYEPGTGPSGYDQPQPTQADPTMQGPAAISTDERNMAALCHLLSLLWTVTGIGGIVGPLILWILKKDESEFIDEHGKSAVNFQIVMFICTIVSGLSICIWIGVLLVPIVLIMNIVFPIIAAVKASQGERYTYPMTYDFLK